MEQSLNFTVFFKQDPKESEKARTIIRDLQVSESFNNMYPLARIANREIKNQWSEGLSCDPCLGLPTVVL